MKVRLVGFTKPSDEFVNDFTDAKELIAFCARVSNPANQYNNDTADKLLTYLKNNKHWSPFEMASATVEVETSRDIARQLLRHRSFSFQEFSQRYANPVEELEFVLREARLQDDKNRQNSIELTPSLSNNLLQQEWAIRQSQIIELVKETYTWAVNNKIAKEQARAVLPEGLTTSRLYVNGTIRSYIHYVDVRTDESTQKEHRELAFAIAQAINQIFPIFNDK